MFCYSNNGLSMRSVEGDYEAADGEVLFADYATPQQLANAFDNYEAEKEKIVIRRQIMDLESTITARRMREAVLGIDNGWMENIDDQIAALRAQL